LFDNLLADYEPLTPEEGCGVAECGADNGTAFGNFN